MKPSPLRSLCDAPSQYPRTHCETFEQYGCVHKINPSEKKEQVASCKKGDGKKKAATCEKKGQVEDQRSGWEKRKIPCTKKVCKDAQKNEKSIDPKEGENSKGKNTQAFDYKEKENTGEENAC